MISKGKFWILILLITGCKASITETDDKVYSRHLQKHIKLTIYNTPVPDDKNSFNLLLFNDGQDMEKLRVKYILDSLTKKKLIQPLVIVGVHTDSRTKDYGVTGYDKEKNNGINATKYSAFVYDELYLFIKKKTGVRKFNSITIAGHSLGALSAFDIGWEHADRINKVGIFSGEFGIKQKDTPLTGNPDPENRIIINKIQSSRKRPTLQYWFYAGNDEEKTDSDGDGIIDVVDNTKNLITLITKKSGSPGIIFKEIKEGKHDLNSWSRVFPEFLMWAAGK